MCETASLAYGHGALLAQPGAGAIIAIIYNFCHEMNLEPNGEQTVRTPRWTEAAPGQAWYMSGKLVAPGSSSVRITLLTM